MGFESKQIAIITGANGGVGYGICQRLLESEGDDLVLVMACRNPTRAKNARGRLLKEFPFAHIDIELVDLNSVESVLSFTAAINNKYPQVNYLFCNAGLLSTNGFNWKQVFYLMFFDPVGLAERADATYQAIGEINEDGMGRVFANNVFGHYVMMRELEKLLSNSGDGRVIWTSSITAEASCFNIDDWQGIKCSEPYESSKWACDIISLALSERFEKEANHIASFTTSPGVVASEIGGFPRWITASRVIGHYMFRFMGVISQNITGYNGSIADVYAALQPLKNLDFLSRYDSSITRWGKSFVRVAPMENYDRDIAQKLVDNCELAYQAFKKNAVIRTATAN